MTATLSNFQILRPGPDLKQEETLRWIAKAHSYAGGHSIGSDFHKEIEDRLCRIGLGPEKIESRGVAVPDCLHEKWDEMQVYNLDHHPRGFSMKERAAFFDKAVSGAFEQFYPEGASLPSYLVHVTCTGYVSPSGAQKVVSKRGGATVVTHAYHMGCYAAVSAVRMAMGFPGACDIVHTELCTLHMNPEMHETEQLVIQSLFADGYIKYSVGKGGPGLAILTLHEEIIPDSQESMSWTCEDWGNRMTVRKEVPVLVARALPGFIEQLEERAGSLKDAYFAIHPGGPKIIQQVAKVLNLEPWQYAASVQIMKQYGNMSSATLPHIWQLLEKDLPAGAKAVSLAFGPGLTMVGGVLECRR